MASIRPAAGPEGKALLAAILLLSLSANAPAQSSPADPLDLLTQQEASQKVAATQEAALEADAQRRMLLDAAGSNGMGTHPERASQIESTLTDQQVANAMKRGVDYLLAEFAKPFVHSPPPDNLFPGEQRRWLSFAGNQQVGLVALDLYALLESARITADPRLHPGSSELQPVVEWLEKAHTGKTYSAALQAAALAALPQNPEVRDALQRVRDDLSHGIRPADGTYGYNLAEHTSPWDNSNTQFGLLGMWAASEAGLTVPHEFWEAQSRHWRLSQAVSGEWAYHLPAQAGQPVDSNAMTTPALTAAGVASLYVTLDRLSGDAIPPGDDLAIHHGMEAIQKDFAANAKYLGDDLYYAFALQRVGVASGAKYIDGINWYRRAAAELIVSQRPNGSWQYANSELAGTGFALLILAHGGSPVLFNKLIYGNSENTWNIHPRDDANITRYLARKMEQPLNWQTVSLAADPDDWLDAPVLLITGKGEPRFTPAELLKLQHYIQRGGIIFSISIDGDAAFTAAAKRYAVELTGGQYEMRKLPPDHPLFTLQEKMDGPFEIWGISNGLRELWIHSPEDLAATWQHSIDALKNDWALAVNLYVYATGKTPPRSRLNTIAVPGEPPHTPAPNGTNSAQSATADTSLHIARLIYDGNADPEPGAWPRLAALMHQQFKHIADGPEKAGQTLTIDRVPINDLDASKTPIALLTGTSAFTLDEKAVSALEQFLQNGGTLIADAAGSSDAFKTSFVKLMETAGLGKEPALLPPTHPLFSGMIPGSVRLDPAHTAYRRGTPPTQRQDGCPEVWAWTFRGRYAVLFSPIDITSGLLGTNTWGIAGYSPDTAQSLARNLLLYALQTRTITQERGAQ